jgi:hypothetical protein
VDESVATRRGSGPGQRLHNRRESTARVQSRERLYVIESPTFTGLWIYTKGTIRRKAGAEVFYVLVSSKLSESGNS